MKRIVLAALLAAALFAAPAAKATDQGIPKPADRAADVTDMQLLRSAVQQDKKSFVASTLDLTEAEAKKFWPIYNLYQRTLDQVDRRRARAFVEVVGRDQRISDPYAKTLALELIAADEAEIKARRTLQNRLMRALPPRKAARYLQLESKIRAVEAYDIAGALPLVR